MQSGAMLLTLLVVVPLLTGLVCLPLRERAVPERLNLLAFAAVAALEAWLGVEVLALSLFPRERVREGKR